MQQDVVRWLLGHTAITLSILRGKACDPALMLYPCKRQGEGRISTWRATKCSRVRPGCLLERTAFSLSRDSMWKPAAAPARCPAFR